MNPHERSWIVNERFFHAEQMPYYETIMTIGNGYMGSRATFEEGYPGELPSNLVHGVFNHHPADLVPDLANIPVWFALQIQINGDNFRLDEGRVLGYRRWLDMRTGLLTRQILWESPQNKVVRLEFERLASMSNVHILLQKVTITALDDIDLKCTAYIDSERAYNLAYGAHGPEKVFHWTNLEVDEGSWRAETAQSGYQVALAEEIQLSDSAVELDSSTDSQITGVQFETVLQNTRQLVLTRFVSIATSRDADDVAAFAQENLRQAVQAGYQTLISQSNSVWDDLWSDMDIVIEGDEFAQLAIRFATYHLLIAAPRQDEHVSIGAKSLSGPGYKGHVFWDTELFMLPPFTFSRPQIARNLLMYRYHNLPGARQKAVEAGYRGAMFPWESTDTGLETTPRWTLPDKSGKRIRIWTGDHEQHISSDIAYAAWQYWQWTGDDDFFTNYGAELILDTAVFWDSRVEWNAEKNRYELHQQIGPDEFHENIDNSVYTNRLVAWHMQHAVQTLQWLQKHNPDQAQKLYQALDIDTEMPDRWQHIANNMYIAVQADLQVYEQFDGYFERNFVEVSNYTPRTTNMDVILGHEMINASQVIKQADVVMLMALLGDKLGDKSFLRHNWETYIPRTAHDSSLSAAIHAWVGAQIGLVDEAYALWIQSAGLDLENNKGNVRDGIHAAACGGLRQAVMLGFAGLQLSVDEKGWTVEPNLPRWWKKVQFHFYYRGQKETITIHNQE